MEAVELILTWRCPDCGHLEATMAHQVPTEHREHGSCVAWMVPKWLPVQVDEGGARYVVRNDGQRAPIG